MDHHADVDAVRRKAIAYCQDFLVRYAGKSPLQTAEGLVDLAFQDPNPVKDVFAVASTNDRPSTAHATETKKSTLSKLLRRDKNASSESKGLGPISSVCDPESRPHGTSHLFAEVLGDPPLDKSVLTNQSKKNHCRINGRPGTFKAPAKPVPNSSVFSSSPDVAKASASTTYKCIVCQDRLSSKGVCKRHLEEQHVTPKVFKCEKCGERFEAKKDAKLHINTCGQGVFLYTTGKQDEKKVYACEYTGECFVSKPKYLEHLLALSEKTEDRPTADPRLKLCALLDQPDLRQQVAEISSRKFESRRAWRNLQWTDAHIAKAIENLEHASVHESGTIDFAKGSPGQKVRVYLNSLLEAGRLPGSHSPSSRRSRSSTMTQRRSPHGSDSGRATPTPMPFIAAQIPADQLGPVESSDMDFHPSMPPPDAAMATMPADMRNKRHLSDQSRAFVPSRLPPGPPIMSQISYAVNPSMPDLQNYNIPSISATTLPFRTQEAPNLVDQSVGDLLSLRTGSTDTPTLSSDAASVSTLMSSFQEPEVVEQLPYDYNFWNTQQSVQNYDFSFVGNVGYGMAMPHCYYSGSDPSIRTSSIATDQTYIGDYNETEQKLSNFEPVPANNTPQFGSTFFLDDDDFHDTHGNN